MLQGHCTQQSKELARARTEARLEQWGLEVAHSHLLPGSRPGSKDLVGSGLGFVTDCPLTHLGKVAMSPAENGKNGIERDPVNESTPGGEVHGFKNTTDTLLMIPITISFLGISMHPKILFFLPMGVIQPSLIVVLAWSQIWPLGAFNLVPGSPR